MNNVQDDLGPLIETARCLQIKGLSMASSDIQTSRNSSKKRSARLVKIHVNTSSARLVKFHVNTSSARLVKFHVNTSSARLVKILY